MTKKNCAQTDIEKQLGSGSVLPKRSDIPDTYKWKLSDIYASDEKWEEDFNAIKKRLPQIAVFSGKLCESAKNLLSCFKLRDELAIILGKLIVYANMKSHEDTAESKYQGLVNRASSLSVEFSTVSSFITPEILSAPAERLTAFINDDGLKEYSFILKDLIRQREHILSQKEEAILARAGDMSGIAENMFSMLTNADMHFTSIKNENGKSVEMSEERAVSYLRSRKRTVRKAAFDSLYRPYCEMKNTLGATFDGMLKTAKFYAAVRKYDSPLAAALDGDNIPESVYDNLVDTLESSLTPMHRYIELRKKILRVNELHMYDLYTPLVKDPFKEILWHEAKEMMFKALKPLGREYLENVRHGIENGWADVFTNKGKEAGHIPGEVMPLIHIYS